MRRTISLAGYVKKRNGLPLGAKGSLTNMFKNSLGASSFNEFWWYWNPIWGYYLSRYVMKPLSQWLPKWLAVVLTFAISGALHDLAVSIVKWQVFFFITPWFILMGIVVVLSKLLHINYAHFPWLVKAGINCAIVLACYFVTRFI